MYMTKILRTVTLSLYLSFSPKSTPVAGHLVGFIKGHLHNCVRSNVCPDSTCVTGSYKIHCEIGQVRTRLIFIRCRETANRRIGESLLREFAQFHGVAAFGKNRRSIKQILATSRLPFTRNSSVNRSNASLKASISGTMRVTWTYKVWREIDGGMFAVALDTCQDIFCTKAWNPHRHTTIRSLRGIII